MVGWHHRLHGHEFEQALGVSYRQGSLKCCCPWDSPGKNAGVGCQFFSKARAVGSISGQHFLVLVYGDSTCMIQGTLKTYKCRVRLFSLFGSISEPGTLGPGPWVSFFQVTMEKAGSSKPISIEWNLENFIL